MQKKGILPLHRIASVLSEVAGSDKGDPSRTGMRSARDAWNIVLEQFEVPDQTIYAIYFNRHGSSVYYIHRHYKDKEEAEEELNVLRGELLLPEAEFEARHRLDGQGI
jgi:hypothetical protein